MGIVTGRDLRDKKKNMETKQKRKQKQKAQKAVTKRANTKPEKKYP